MKPLFKNVTRYTQKNYQQFVRFHNNKFNARYMLYTFIMSLLILYCVILNVLQKNIWFVLIFILILLGFLFIRICIPSIRYKKACNQYKNGKSDTFAFTFYNHFFTIGKIRYYYFKLHKVYETKDYFYLYFDEDNAALVSKNGFKLGKPNDFSDFIKKKCLLKYSKQN